MVLLISNRFIPLLSVSSWILIIYWYILRNDWLNVPELHNRLNCELLLRPVSSFLHPAPNWSSSRGFSPERSTRTRGTGIGRRAGLGRQECSRCWQCAIKVPGEKATENVIRVIEKIYDLRLLMRLLWLKVNLSTLNKI